MQEEALTKWMRTLVGYVRSDHPDLSNRQMALMLLISSSPGPHTVRGIARELSVNKPVISRAVSTLSLAGFLKRQRDDMDRRNIFIMLTEKGSAFLQDFDRLLAGRGDACGWLN